MVAQSRPFQRFTSDLFLADIAVPTTTSKAVRRVQWSFSVSPRDVFTLCRALVACEYVDIIRCTPVVKRHQSQIRVEITLPVDKISAIMSHVICAVDNAEIGRTQSLDAC